MTAHPSSLEGGDSFKMLSWTIMYYSAEKLFFELIASVVTSSSTERVTKTWSTPTFFFVFANHKKCYICFWQTLQPSDTLCSLTCSFEFVVNWGSRKRTVSFIIDDMILRAIDTMLLHWRTSETLNLVAIGCKFYPWSIIKWCKEMKESFCIG